MVLVLAEQLKPVPVGVPDSVTPLGSVSVIVIGLVSSPAEAETVPVSV